MVWAVGAYAHLFQHFSLVVHGFSRAVAISFKVDQHYQVWSYNVSLIAQHLVFFFPLGFVTLFAWDGPQISLGTGVVWDNHILYAGYRLILFVVYATTSGLTITWIVIAVLRRMYLQRARRLASGLSSIPSGDRARIVHTVRTSEELSNQSIHYQPSTIPEINNETSFTVVTGICLAVNLGQFIYLKQDFPTADDYGEQAVTALATFVFPVGITYLLMVPIFRHKLRNDRGLLFRLYRRLTGPTMRDVAVVPPKVELTTVASIYQPRRNTISVSP
ncbi:unnamed protein product, partial [Mesorhabditis spiculigera]